MSHADDGTLHAYLDGQLSPVERTQLEAHLASCPACRARLDEERGLIERADALLALATPPERAIPPFHQLRPSPSPPPPQPRPLWQFRLPAVWAATVLLALGLGWYLGGARAMRAPPPSLPGGSVAKATRADTGATNALALRSMEPAREERQQRVVTPGTIPTGGRADERAADRVAAESEPRPSAGASPTAAPLQVAPAFPQAQPRAELKATPPPTTAANVPAEVDGGVVTGQARPVRSRSLVVLTSSWTIIGLDAARPTLGVNPVTIPGLPVRDVRRSPLGDGVILVEQAVDQATVVQLFQRRADRPEVSLRSRARADSLAARDYAAAAQSQGVERLARYVGGLRVEIAGPLPTDSLSKLLELVK